MRFFNKQRLVLISSMFLAITFVLPAYTLTKAQKLKIKRAIENHEKKPEKVLEVKRWLKGLILKETEKNQATDYPSYKEHEVLLGHLAKVEFIIAIDEPSKKLRIAKYQTAIDTASDLIEMSPKSIPGNFWKAAAIGKQGLDIGITKSLSNAKPMKKHLEVVLAQDEKLEQGGPHRAMGRLYFKLPGWPISFGDNKKSEEHLRKAVKIDPKHLGNRAYLAETLEALGKDKEAREHMEYVLSAKVNPKRKREMQEFVNIATDLKKELSD